MANKKISALTELTAVAYNDYLAIVDTTAGSTKKISMNNLVYSYMVVAGIANLGTGRTDGELKITADEYGNRYTWDDDNSKWRIHDGNQYTTAGLPTTGSYTIPTGTMVFDVTTGTFKRWNGSAWIGSWTISTAASGVTASTDADDLIVENNAAGGLSILTPNTAAGNLFFGDPEDPDEAGLVYDHADRGLQLKSCGSIAARFGTAGQLFINETENSKMAGNGLTINQGANDDEIFALKSSDVAHGVTTQTETDTYYLTKKYSSTLGGVMKNSFSESSECEFHQGFATSFNATKTTAGSGTFQLQAYLISGTTINDNVTANGNLFAVKSRVGGVNQTKFIVDHEGDYYYDGSGSAYDAYDDAVLLRAIDSDSQNAIKTAFDVFVKEMKDDLVNTKIIGKDSYEREPFTHKKIHSRGLINGAQLQRLHNGAIWQGRLLDQAIINTVRELMPDRFDDILQKNMADLGIGHVKLLH